MFVVPSKVQGLTSEQVAERIQRGDVNTLPPRSGRTTWDIVSTNVFTRVNLILFVLFLCVLTTGQLLQGLFALLIIANSITGIIQELRAKHTLDKLAVVGEAKPVVIRDGEAQTLVRDNVVLDDIIAVTPGDQVVVDGEVVAADYLEVDESLLTGESDPMPKEPGDEILSGSFIVSGTGFYRATRIGAEAYAAQITAQASKFTLVSSELRSGINQILRYVSWLLVPVGILSIAVQFSTPGTTWQEAVLGMTASLVPMVPEGLVLLTAMAFALGVIRLGRRGVLVQELPAIEMLARVDVVCADKTGTLTSNEMALGQIIPIGYEEEAVREVLTQLVTADPSPNASMQAIGEGVGQAPEPWEVVARAPFTSAKKWSGVSFDDDRHYVLGAPDVLATDEVAAQAHDIAVTGRRVLLLARAETRVDDEAAPGQLAPVALLVLEQVVRDDAADTLKYFQSQNVAVKVISGDNADSVGAVTRSLGVDLGETVDARTLPKPGKEFTERVNEGGVFGRVTPEQKREMVHALQEKGHTVAMTGDGVNDVLALKDSDLGVAMGSGSSATRGVAQLVLLEDKFATLPHVVAEGRRVIGNIERVAKLFLTKTIYSVTFALIFGLFTVPFPFKPLHVTVVGWFTIGIPAFLLSLAPNRDRARSGFVRRTLSLSVPAGIIVATSVILAYLFTRGQGTVSGAVQASSTTASLIALIMVATWTLSVVARPYYLWRILLVAFAYLFYTGMFLLPWSRNILGLDISDPDRILIGLVSGGMGMILIEIMWWVRARIMKTPARLFA